MQKQFWFFLLLCLPFISCGGNNTVVVTAVPTAQVPGDVEQSDNGLPPTFTPEAVEFEQPTPVTPMPTATSAPPTAAPLPLEPDALQLVLAAENNLRSLSSFSHQRSITVNTPAFEQTEDISCVFQVPDEAFCDAYRETIPVTGDPTVRDFEFVQRGTQLWARGNSEAAWESLPPDDINYLESYSSQLILSPYVTDAFIFGESAIEGIPVYEIRLTLDPVPAVEALYSGESFAEFLAQAQDKEATATVWVGQVDSYLRLLTIEIRFSTPLGDATLNGLGTIDDFNETPSIPQP